MTHWLITVLLLLSLSNFQSLDFELDGQRSSSLIQPPLQHNNVPNGTCCPNGRVLIKSQQEAGIIQNQEWVVFCHESHSQSLVKVWIPNDQWLANDWLTQLSWFAAEGQWENDTAEAVFVDGMQSTHSNAAFLHPSLRVWALIDRLSVTVGLGLIVDCVFPDYDYDSWLRLCRFFPRKIVAGEIAIIWLLLYNIYLYIKLYIYYYIFWYNYTK